MPFLQRSHRLPLPPGRGARCPLHARAAPPTSQYPRVAATAYGRLASSLSFLRIDPTTSVFAPGPSPSPTKASAVANDAAIYLDGLFSSSIRPLRFFAQFLPEKLSLPSSLQAAGFGPTPHALSHVRCPGLHVNPAQAPFVKSTPYFFCLSPLAHTILSPLSIARSLSRRRPFFACFRLSVLCPPWDASNVFSLIS